VFEGYNLAYTTSEDISGVQSALNTGTGGLWTTVKGGLSYPGKIESALDMFDAKIEAKGLDLEVLDVDDALISLLSREADSTIARSELTTTVNATDTVLTLGDVSAFSASGTVYLGNEEIDYTSKTGTTNGTLNGCTRGKRALFYTDGGAALEFGVPHRVDSDTGETGGYRPLVTQLPRSFFNRQVALYLLHYEEGTGWSAPGPSAPSEASLLWVGRLKSWQDAGDGRVRLSTVSVLERLSTTLLPDQYRGKVTEGFYLNTRDAQFRVTISVTVTAGPTHTRYFGANYATLSGTNSYRTHQEIASSINDQLLDWFNTGTASFPSDMRMAIVWKGSDSGLPHYEFELRSPSAIAVATYKIDVYLSPAVWQVLGWTTGGERTKTPDGYLVDRRSLERQNSNETFHLQAPEPPRRFTIRADVPLGSGLVLQVTTIGGTSYRTQSSVPASMGLGSPTGFLRIGEVILPVKVSSTSGDVTTFVMTGPPVGGFLIKDGYDDNAAATTLLKILGSADDMNSEDLIAEQVWCEQGEVGDIMLKLLASTGTAGYNHASYDYFPDGVGAGIPWSLIDELSWRNLGKHSYLLFLEKPTPLRTLLESALKVLGHYCVFKDGKISVVTIGEEWSGSSRLVALTESNKAQVVRDGREPVIQAGSVERNPEGIINQMKLRFNRTLDGKWNRNVTVNARSSQTDYGQVRTNTADAYGFYEMAGAPQSSGVVAWQKDTAAVALAYFSRPMAAFHRTVDYQTATRLSPGSRVSISDNRIIDPTTGTRGVSSLMGWCTKITTDWRNATGEGEFVFCPDLASVRLGSWSPSGRVDEAEFTNGYDSATKRLQIKQHEYSETTEDKDISYFAAGDKVRIVDLDPANAHNFTAWSDTINAVDEANDYVTLTTGLTGFPSTGYFVMEYDDAATVTSAQRTTGVFLAAPTTLTTGVATRDAKLYGAREAEKPSTAVAYTGSPYRRGRNTDDDQAEPFSVHKLNDLMRFANQALGGYECNPIACWQHDDGSISTTGSTAFETMAGPLFVPLRSPRKTLRVTVDAKIFKGGGVADGNGTIRVISSILLVRNSTATSQPWLGSTYLDGPTNFVDLSITNATDEYQLLSGDLTASLAPGGSGALGTWITLEAKVLTGASDGVNIRGLTVAEKPW
jgi:hypothetical protein